MPAPVLTHTLKHHPCTQAQERERKEAEGGNGNGNGTRRGILKERRRSSSTPSVVKTNEHELEVFAFRGTEEPLSVSAQQTQQSSASGPFVGEDPHADPFEDAESNPTDPRDEDTESLVDEYGYVRWKLLDEQTEQERKAVLNSSWKIGILLTWLAITIMFIILFGVVVLSATKYGFS